jgi:hypothetical protein
MLSPVALSQTKGIGRNEVRTAVQRIADTTAKYYVYPEKGASANNELLSRAKSGRYDSIAGWPSFKAALTKELREIMLDKHMYVLYEPQDIKVLNNQDNRSPEEIGTYFKNKARRINYGF